MTDIAMPARGKASVGPRYFYFQMALVCMAVAFLGFLPTYWMPMAQGTAQFDPVVHIHGMIFFAWTLFFVFQTWIGARGQVARRRAVGLIGVSLATAMVIFGVIISIHVMRVAVAHGKPEDGIRLAVVPLTNITLFMVLMIAAFLNTRRPEWHKRLMLLAAISILGAPIVRWFIALEHVPRPPPVIVPLQAEGLVVLLCLVAILRDWRLSGKLHPAWLWGFGGVLTVRLLQATISQTPAWHAIAGWVSGLAG
jgi:hypothetical protein